MLPLLWHLASEWYLGLVFIHFPLFKMAASYVSLFDLGESRDDVEVDYNSLHHYRVTLKILE